MYKLKALLVKVNIHEELRTSLSLNTNFLLLTAIIPQTTSSEKNILKFHHIFFSEERSQS